MLRAVTLAAAVAAALAAYFVLSLYIVPQSLSIEPRRPEPAVTGVSQSAPEIELGNSFTVSVVATNRGDEADMQIVTVSFPNLTRIDGNVKVLRHDFRQTPIIVDAGDPVGSGYAGLEKRINATNASVEAFSRPWERGGTYSIDMQVTPEAQGRFVIFVKSVALPHNWERAHYPHEGVMDYQQEFVQVYYVDVAKP